MKGRGGDDILIFPFCFLEFFFEGVFPDFVLVFHCVLFSFFFRVYYCIVSLSLC